MKVEPLQDVMNYFFYAMLPLYLFLVSSLVLFIASFKQKNLLPYSLVITLLFGISLFFSCIFMGVLADNRANFVDTYYIVNLIFIIPSLVLFFTQLVRNVLWAKKTKK